MSVKNDLETAESELRVAISRAVYDFYVKTGLGVSSINASHVEVDDHVVLWPRFTYVLEEMELFPPEVEPTPK